MMNRFCKILLVVIATLIPLADCLATTQDGELTMGIFPRRNPLITNKMFGPLCDYLSYKLGVKVILRIPSNFESFWEGVEKREYDIVHFNQYHYVKAHKKYNYNVIVKNIEFGQATIAGALIVRKDSGIRQVSDLKGKVIVFGGGQTAMQSYIVARYLLQQHGLNVGDYTESFAKNPPNAIMSAYFNQSAAAGSGDKVLNLKVVSGKINISEMDYLARGEQLSHLPWVVKSELPNGMSDELQQILIELTASKQGRVLLKKMRLDGFSEATDRDYDPHRIIIREVLGESY